MATTTICDRCGTRVLNDDSDWGDLALRWMIRPNSALATSRGPVIDLCGPCRGDLAEWFRQGGLRDAIR